MDKTAAKFIAGKDCDMVVLRDTKNLRPVQYAIALQKDRPAEGGETLLRKFNKAIDELKKDGTIQQLKDKYWENKCKWTPPSGKMLENDPELIRTRSDCDLI